MKTRLWKELRALAPWFLAMVAVGVLALAMLQMRLPPQEGIARFINLSSGNIGEVMGLASAHFISFFDLTIVVVGFLQVILFTLAASGLYGTEFSLGSIQRLLSQPVSRNRIWIEKSLVLVLLILIAIAMDSLLCWRMSSFLGHVDTVIKQFASARDISVQLLQESFIHDKVYPFVWRVLVLGSMALATAPALSLWLRQTHTAFWATLVLPYIAFFILLGVLTFFDLIWFRPKGLSIFKYIETPDWAPACSRGDGIFLFTVAGAIWCAILYPLGWLKFRRLEV